MISIVVIALITIFYPKIYTTDPGYVTQEDAIQFYKTKQKCFGLSVTIENNELADVPVIAKCFGVLI